MNIKEIINKYIKKDKKSKPLQNKYILNKITQTTFIKKRKSIKINNLHFKKFSFFNKSNYFIILIILLILIITIYYIISNSLKVKFIEIIKQDNITNMNIAYNAVDKYRGKNILSVDKKDILKNLKDYQQNIKNINLKISLPNTLKININSYKALFNTEINNKKYIITANGVLVPHSNIDNLKNIQIIKKFDKNIFFDYKKIFNDSLIKNISYIINNLKENIINLKIENIKYYVTERELHIKTKQNTILIFNINSNINEQIKKITIFNKEQKSINTNDIIYFDLRVKNKIFYCSTENEYQCYQNLKNIYHKG